MPLQHKVEQKPAQDDENGYDPEENQNQFEGHNFFEEGCFGQGKADGSHHEGDCSTERDALGHKNLNDRHDARRVGIERNDQHNCEWYGVPGIRADVLLKEIFGHVAVNAGAYAYANQNIDENAFHDVVGFAGNAKRDAAPHRTFICWDTVDCASGMFS